MLVSTDSIVLLKFIVYLTSPSAARNLKEDCYGSLQTLLAGEGRGNLQTFCPKFKTPLRSSQRLRGFDPASHLRFQNPCNFHTLDRFRCSWQAAVVDLWDSFPPNILLESHTNGWRTVLQNIQRYIMTL